MEFSKDNLIVYYKHGAFLKKLLLVGLFLAIIVAFILAISVGPTYVPFNKVVQGIFGASDHNTNLTIQGIRLPRALAALIAGGGLAISGCIMQNVLKNEMASPSTLGVGNAAVFGANLAIIVFGVGSFGTSSGIIDLNNPYVVGIFAFIFALLCIFLILFLAKIKHFTNEAIVLAGIAVGTIFNAGTLIIQYFSEEGELASAVFWSFGDLGRATYRECLIMFCVVVISFLYFSFRTWDYTAIASGRDLASTLGVRVERVSIVSLLLASLITALCVSFLGIIGFVGLIAPQIMKVFTKDDFRYLMPSSFLFGSLLLLVADILSRVIIPATPLPVGAITSLLGGPMFIYLLIRKKAR